MKQRYLSAAAIAVVATFTLAACGSDDDATGATDAPGVTAAPGTDAPDGTEAPAPTLATGETGVPVDNSGGLTIADFTFGTATAQAGAPLPLTNKDGFAHTVTAKDGTFDVRVEAGGTASVTIDTPGTYDIICKIHPQMAGTITVE